LMRNGKIRYVAACDWNHLSDWVNAIISLH